MKKAVFIFVAIAFFGCHKPTEKKTKSLEKQSFADSLIDKSIEFYGMHKLNKSNISFNFREYSYTAILNQGEFEYTRFKVNQTNDSVFDVLNNKGFNRFVNQNKVVVDSAKSQAYSNSINSVWYFILLPLRLKDEAAQKTYLGLLEINGKSYHIIKVTFAKEGGGKDFDDEYLYWFNKSNLKMEMFAYNYATDGGGVRFRTFKSDTLVNGVLFQNYFNLKPKSQKTPLDSLPHLCLKNQLDTVSIIENTAINVTFID